MNINLEILTALSFFALVMCITPGPNNLYLMASGTAFGWRRTIPYWIGVTVGFMILITLVAFGLGSVVLYFPFVPMVMKLAGVTWMVIIGIKSLHQVFSNTKNADSSAKANQPLSALDAVLLQWLNPKSWTMAIGCTSAYVDLSESLVVRAGSMSLVFLIIMPPCTAIWMLSGAGLRKFMNSDATRRIADSIVASLLLLSAVMLLRG